MRPDDPNHTPKFDHRLVRALDHPVRVGFLRMLAERPTLTVGEASTLLGQPGLPLSNLTYHVRVLTLFEFIQPAAKADAEKGLAFRATSRGEEALAALGLSQGGG
jgi:hypothetical protein